MSAVCIESGAPTTQCGCESCEPVEQKVAATVEGPAPAIDAEVARLAEQMFRTEQARTIARRKSLGDIEPSNLPMVTAADLIASNLPEVEYRIEDLITVGSRVVINAAAKTGKTTLLIALASSLIHGTPFLGALMTLPLRGRVLYIDGELPPTTLRKWLKAANLDTDRLIVMGMRGRMRDLAAVLEDPRKRATWTQILRHHDIAAIILDPFTAYIAATGRDENSNTEVGYVLRNVFDALFVEANLDHLFIAHHTGHNEERGRGAKALEDWADVIARYVKAENSEGNDGPRFITAWGRDVDFPERAVELHNGQLTLGDEGTSRRAFKATEAADATFMQQKTRVLHELQQAGGYVESTKRLRALTGLTTNGRLANAVDALALQGAITVERDGNKVTYRLATNTLNYSADVGSSRPVVDSGPLPNTTTNTPKVIHRDSP